MNIISPNFSDLLKSNIEIKQFPDGDNYIYIKEELQGEKITLFHRLYPEQDKSLIQAIFILKNLNEKGFEVTMVTPYLPYSRQDKTWRDGECLSAKYICEMLAWAGVKKLITFDCHFLKEEGEFNFHGLKIQNISMNKKLIQHAKELFNGEEFEVVSPDLGASYMVGDAGKSMKKKRGDYNSGEEAYRKIEEVKMDFEVDGKNILVIDDMIAGGGTMIKAIENLKKNNGKKIIACSTHGFFLKNSLNKIKNMCDGVFVSNTIPSEAAKVNFMDLVKGEIET